METEHFNINFSVLLFLSVFNIIPELEKVWLNGQVKRIKRSQE